MIILRTRANTIRTVLYHFIDAAVVEDNNLHTFEPFLHITFDLHIGFFVSVLCIFD